MPLHLGFFPDFKGGDTVLLDGSPDDITTLAEHVVHFARPSAAVLAIHVLAHASARHPVRLFAGTPDPSETDGYVWHISADGAYAVQDALLSLANAGQGHQYFDLQGGQAQLLVSCGEYGETWWQTHG